MPTYAYQCEQCGYGFEDWLSISKREEPTQEPCPNCKQKEVKQAINCEGGWMYVTYRNKQLPQSFRDTMNGIKKNHRGSTMPDY